MTNWYRRVKSDFQLSQEHLATQCCQTCGGTGRNPEAPEDVGFWEGRCGDCNGTGFKPDAVRRHLKVGNTNRLTVSIRGGCLEVDINDAILNALQESTAEELLDELGCRREVLEYTIEKLAHEYTSDSMDTELGKARFDFLEKVNAQAVKHLQRRVSTVLTNLAGKVQDLHALQTLVEAFVRYCEDTGVPDAWAKYWELRGATNPLPTALSYDWETRRRMWADLVDATFKRPEPTRHLTAALYFMWGAEQEGAVHQGWKASEALDGLCLTLGLEPSLVRRELDAGARNQRIKAMNQERRKLIAQAQSILEQVRDDEQEAFDNTPEGLQQSERGSNMETAVEKLSEAVESIEAAVDAADEAST